MRDVNEVAEKMARNGFKIAKSLGCAFHFESEFIYLSMYLRETFSGRTNYQSFSPEGLASLGSTATTV